MMPMTLDNVGMPSCIGVIADREHGVTNNLITHRSKTIVQTSQIITESESTTIRARAEQLGEQYRKHAWNANALIL